MNTGTLPRTVSLLKAPLTNLKVISGKSPRRWPRKGNILSLLLPHEFPLPNPPSQNPLGFLSDLQEEEQPPQLEAIRIKSELFSPSPVKKRRANKPHI